MRIASLKPDLVSGFLVFLIALPLCLGISMASGFPPIAGVFTAIVGGVVVTFLGSARLTIKGPAAGLIVIAIGAVTELGRGDMALGYRRALAVGVVAGVIQVIFALGRAGAIGDIMPPSVVHGMLAAIGVIIISKQAHTVLGVSPSGKEPLHLLMEIPQSVAALNPEVFFIGGIALIILFAMPMLPMAWAKKIPAPMVVLAVAIPLAFAFDLSHEHTYALAGHAYHVGPGSLVRLPASLLGAVSFPDFSVVTSATSIKYIIMFALVGTIESLLSVKAVDALDPEKCASDLDKDLLATGIGNTIASLIGGLPMISEIVRSKANIDNGAKTKWSNFFHGAFLLLSVALIPTVLQEIPLAALGAMLIYTGTRLASPREFVHAFKIGPEQLTIFVTTFLVTLTTDLLVGVAVGIALKIALHLKNGATVKGLLKASINERRENDALILDVNDAAVFTNYLSLKRRLRNLDDDIRSVEINFENAALVDHTVFENLHQMQHEWVGRTMVLRGLDRHEAMSNHALAARRRRRPQAA